jgi:hypothetical protein
MSVLTSIFVASDNDLEEIDPRKGPSDVTGRHFPIYEATSVDEVVLATLEALMTGTPYDDIMAETEYEPGTDVSFFEVGPALVDALAALPDDAIPATAARWSERDGWAPGPDLEPLIGGLVGLARQARATEKDLWVWTEML